MTCTFDYIVTENPVNFYLLGYYLFFLIIIIIYLIFVIRVIRAFRKYNHNHLRIIPIATMMSHNQRRLTNTIISFEAIYIFTYLILLISGIVREVDFGIELANFLIRFITRKSFFMIERYSSCIFPLLFVFGDRNISNEIRTILDSIKRSFFKF